MTSPIVITQGKSAFLYTTEGFPPFIMKWIGLLMSVSLLHRRNRLAQTCSVSFNPDWLTENLLCLQNKSAPSVQRFILKSSVCSNAAGFDWKTHLTRKAALLSWAENSLFQFCLTITKPFSSFLSRGNEKLLKSYHFHVLLVV